MKRDMDLIRALALRMEEYEHAILEDMDLQFAGYTEEQVKYHIFLMDDAGLIRGKPLQMISPGRVIGSSKPLMTPYYLLSAGHDFAAQVRDDTIWNRAKKTIADKVISVSLGLLSEYIKSLVREKLGISA